MNFSGERTETIVVSSKDYISVPHVVDYKKVSEEVRKYLIELRRINGIDIPVPAVNDKALRYAKARANEMVANNKLSHDTKLKIKILVLRMRLKMQQLVRFQKRVY